MLFDALERVYTVVNANFNADLATLCSAKGVTTLTAAIIKRQDADYMRKHYQVFPAIGLYSDGADTQMADGGLGGKRDSDCDIRADLVIVGTDGPLMQAQGELSAEVLVKAMCERVPQGANTTFAGGLQKRSVSVAVSSVPLDEQGVNYMVLVTVRVPIFDRDNTT